MAQIEWETSFSIGNDTIDMQHRKWIQLYNDLDGVLQETDPAKSTRIKVEALKAMQEYAHYHFRFEENYMKDIRYPEQAQHWRMHKDFDYKLFEYIRQMETGGIVLNSEILAITREWLIGHILTEDIKIERFQDAAPTKNKEHA
jgi:hemerythrin